VGGRVIQGFFIGGAMRSRFVPRAAATKAQPGHAIGAPPPAFAGRAAPLQARMAPGRPALVHQGAGRAAQPYGAGAAFEIDAAAVGLASSGGKPLPRAVLAKMEAAFGADFSAVRIHVGPQATRIGAIAFTMGNDLYFAPGQFQPDSVKGQQLIGHELAHVIQQRQGRVRAPASGVAVVQDMALEAEADRLGIRAASLPAPVQRKASGWTAPGHDRRSIQRMQYYAYSDSDDEEELDDGNYGQDDEYDPNQDPEEYDPEEYMGMGSDPRPSPYSSNFASIYSGSKFVSTNVQTPNGTLTVVCAPFTCTNKFHGKHCDGNVYIVKQTFLSVTTPVTKTKKNNRVTVHEKPPMCHIVDWVILRDAMKIFLGANVNSGFEKFLCWGNLDNLTTGRRTCNSKSNKGQKKYSDLSKGDAQKVDNYVSMMFKQYQTSATVGYYGPIL
jgi:hypothetical protein